MGLEDLIAAYREILEDSPLNYVRQWKENHPGLGGLHQEGG